MIKHIGYFADCFKLDTSNKSVWNIHSKNIELLNTYSSCNYEEVFSNTQSIQITKAYAEKAITSIETYRREKSFYVASHFVIGLRQRFDYGNSKIQTVCSPLFLYPAEIVSNPDHSHIEFQSENHQWNDSLLSELLPDKTERDEFKHAFDASSNFSGTKNLVASINRINPCLTEATLKNISAEQCRKFLKNKGNGEFYFVTSLCSFQLENSRSNRGIADELNNLSTSKAYSLPLRKILVDLVENDPTEAKITDTSFVPGILSKAQREIIRTASEIPLSVLIGPPGTGKSYTIASLALERFVQGESVLVVSNNEHAVDVVHTKITETFGLSQSAVMRSGEKEYHRDLKKRLDSILKSTNDKLPIRKQRKALKKISKQLVHVENRIEKRILKAQRTGNFLLRIDNSEKEYDLFSRIRIWHLQRQQKNNGLLFNDLKDAQTISKQREKLLSVYLTNLAKDKYLKIIRNDKNQLKEFRTAIGARTSQRQEKLFSAIDLDLIIKAMPIWLCSLDSIHKALPLEKELFDLVIIDEATQCDIASCLPALQRAKRALIVGDPKQLRHVSFLSRDMQAKLLVKHDLSEEEVDISYRDESILDYAIKRIENSTSSVLLTEHYRSLPDIISFSNRYFYDSKLRIMTEKPGLNESDAVKILYVKDAERVNGINKVEARAVIDKLRSLIYEQKTIQKDFQLSVGVLAFFSDQAEYLQNLIFKEFDLDEIMSHKIRAGTPFAFQGEERDIMLISCTIDKDTSASSYTYMNRHDVFNVGITRARETQYIFLSSQPKEINSKSILYEYISSVGKLKTKYTPNLSQRHEIINDLCSEIQKLGITILMNYPIAGFSMDLVLIRDGLTIAVDLIGFPGEESYGFHLDNYKIFERAGLTILPIELSAWYFKKADVIESIKALFITIKEESTAQKLAESSTLNQWIKLIPLNSTLAEQVKDIEADILSLNLKQEQTLLEGVIDQYMKTQWILSERLQPNELTFMRYTSSCEQVLLVSLDNLAKICDIHRSINANKYSLTDIGSVSTDHQDIVKNLQAEVQDAIESLKELALKWASQTTSALAQGDMASSLKDLDELNIRIEKYT